MERGLEVTQHYEPIAPVESTITLKWGIILALVIGFFSYLAVTSIVHESRITKMETKLEVHLPIISDSLKEMKETISAIRNDQIKRSEKER
jgi:hypothetical protein